METNTETNNNRKTQVENRQLLKIIENLVKGILLVILALSIALFTTIPNQKEATFFHHAKQLSIIIIRQFTRLFPGQYADADKWRDRANEFLRVWNEVMNGVSGNNQNRRQGDPK